MAERIELEQLKQRRAVTRSKVDAAFIKIDQLIAEPGNHHHVLRYIEYLTDLRFKLEAVQRNIETETGTEDMQVEVNYWTEVNDTILEYLSKGDAYVLQSREVANADDGESVNVCSSTGNAPIRLPELKLPLFSGDYSQFNDFWGQFKAAVHENDELDCTQKLVYLKSCLRGEALLAISGYAVNADNYAVIVEVLKQRYKQPRRIMEKLIKNIVYGVNRPVAASQRTSQSTSYYSCSYDIDQNTKLDDSSIKLDLGESQVETKIRQLQKMQNNLQANSRNLDIIGKSPDLEGGLTAADVLVTIAKQQLPLDTRRRWERETLQEEAISWKMFLDFVDGEVQLEEASTC